MIFTRGMRDKLSKYLDTNNNIQVDMNINGSSVYDFCCFGVDSNGKLSDDRYMIFYNQTSALEMYSRPNSEHRIGYRGNTVVMDIGPEGRSK